MDLKSTLTLRTGDEIPIIGIGTWKLDNNTSDSIRHALEIGYPMIDTSGDYGTQPGIAEGIQQSGLNRKDFYLVTKVEETDDAYQATIKNLQELRLDYADLMLIHRPPRVGFGEELWQGLIKAKSEGLVKNIGVSNYSIDQIESLIDATGEMPVVNQIEWSPFGHSQEMFDYCVQNSIIIQAYSPLTRARKFNDEVLMGIAKKHQKTPAQILLKWNLQLGTVPLPKANKKEHQEENIDIFDFALDQEDFDKLNSLNEHYSSLGELPYV